jgi:hypothetical protein
VKNSIPQIGIELIINLIQYFSNDGDILTLAKMEKDLTPMIKETVSRISSQYIEDVDERLRNDKKGRKEVGYAVERRGDARTVLTAIGELSYGRTYYSHRDGGYEYLVDTAIEIEKYDRISNGVSVALVGASCDMSYAKSSEYTIDSAVSRQTVMKHIRNREAAKPPDVQEKRKVPVLHIDADEAHVTLVGGKKSIVPLVSVYEGIVRQGKRGYCKNIFHISEYGKKPEDLWIQVLDEIMVRYDIEDTRIYLHGDGAKWIKTGLEWLPGAILVLDKYHKNKAITAMTAGLDKGARKLFNREIHSALNDNDVRFFKELANSLISQLPNREEIITQAATYLHNHIEAIYVCSVDPEANFGGCTEPHVAHILSRRLSSFPLAWSEESLKQLSPMLANGGNIAQQSKSHSRSVERILKRATQGARKAIKKIKFAPDPNAIGNMVPISTGKVNQLYRTLNSISQKKLI